MRRIQQIPPEPHTDDGFHLGRHGNGHDLGHLLCITVDWLEQGLDQPLGYAVRIGLLRIGFGLGIPIALLRINPQGNHLLGNEMLIKALKSFDSCIAFPAWHMTAAFLVFGIALCAPLTMSILSSIS